MRITELLKKDTIILDLKSTSKADVIDELVGKLDEAGRLSDRAGYKEAILNRESQSTTGIGEGIAIPHAKTSSVKTPAIAFGRSTEGIDYESLDGQPAHLFFMIAASEGANNAHLETLSRLSTLLMDESFRKTLLTASSIDEVIKAIDDKETENEAPEEEVDTASDQLVLAVTACPTGIAHTYMAADSLKAKAKDMNVTLKVETNGSSGVKKVIQVPVAEGIRKPEELINRALKGDAPVYSGGGGSKEGGESKGSERTGFYKHLMSGVSAMLPFVVGGGILIAISFMFGIHSAEPKDPTYNAFAAALKTIGGDNAFFFLVPVLAGFIAMSIADRPGLSRALLAGLLGAAGGGGFLGGLIAGFLAGYVVVGLKKLFSGLPQALDGIKPVLLYPLFGIFISGLIMLYVVNEPVSAINKGLTHWLSGFGTGNLVLLGIILGGMMAIDMGGPINKAAFTFGIAMIDAGNYAPHAAIMAGGMVPPLGMAIATTLFKNKFTRQERETGKTCYVMGLS